MVVGIFNPPCHKIGMASGSFKALQSYLVHDMEKPYRKEHRLQVVESNF